MDTLLGLSYVRILKKNECRYIAIIILLKQWKLKAIQGKKIYRWVEHGYHLEI